MQEDMQVAAYYVGLLLPVACTPVCCSMNWAMAHKGISYLLLPASTLEKLLAAILYGVVLYFICYTAVFYIVDFVMVQSI